MKIAIFGGTTEGRVISGRLVSEGAEVDVFVATPYGSEEQGELDGVEVHVGRMTSHEMQQAIRCAELCIDATHPYAREATANIRTACERGDIPYYRLKRPDGEVCEGDDVLPMGSVGSVVSWLSGQKGNILITTGSKELEQYAGAGAERLYQRVLPVHESIAACERAGIPHRNIIAMQGPFSREMNEAMIRQFDIEFLVTKESGRPGGFSEKIAAARACGIKSVVIVRPEEEGYSMEEIYELCRRKIK